MLAICAAIVLVLLAALHSVLGEKDVLRRLFTQEWEIGIAPDAARGLLRFVWHLASVAWVGMAALLLGVSGLQCVAWICVASAMLIFVYLRGHAAWPLFLAVAICTWEYGDVWPGGEFLLWVALGVGIAIGVGAAALHFYWAAGGRWAFDAAIPEGPKGTPAFAPGPGLCALVGVFLAFWTVCLAVPIYVEDPTWQPWILKVSLAFLGLRAIGNGRDVGLSKQDRSTLFARRDDAYYTPLVLMMTLAALAAIKLA